MKLSWEIDGVNTLTKKLEDGIEDGMERAMDQILENLERDAKDRIAVRPHIFTGEVYESFEDQRGNADVKRGLSARFLNASKHAGALEHGVHRSKYADGAPPIAALMPWVLAKLNDWNIDDDGSGKSAIKTPHAGDDDDDSEIDDTDYEADWTLFHDNGYNDDDLWAGQRVVGYDGGEGEYFDGVVEEIDRQRAPSVDIRRDSDDSIYTFYLRTGTETDGSGIAAGEDWHSLTLTQQREITRDLVQSEIDISSDFSTSNRQDIDDALNQYVDNTNDPLHVKRMAQGISQIQQRDDISSNTKGHWQGDETSGHVMFNEAKLDRSTIRHEFGHAFISLQGYDYVTGARHDDLQQGEQWDSVQQFMDGSLPWMYDSLDSDHWDTGQAQPLPHPTTYMLHHEDDREYVGLYDDVDGDGFEQWYEHIQTQTKYRLQTAVGEDDSLPEYDSFYDEQTVFDPNSGRAREGDALHFANVAGDDRKDFHVKIESGVYEKPDEPGFAIDISKDGQVDRLDVDYDGTLEDDDLEFEGFLPGGADELPGYDDGNRIEEGAVPDDPGFYAGDNEPVAQLTEALNREMWREMLATELAKNDNRPSWYMRSDGYSATNAHEIMAHFVAIIFSKDDTYKNDIEKIEDLLERSPELIYMGAQMFEFSDEMIDALEQESGLSFDDLLYDIWREHIK